MLTQYLDEDRDGYGDSEEVVTQCVLLDDYVTTGDDCDDTDSSVHPGATEDCQDQIDNDCDGDAATAVWFVDLDDDGFGVNVAEKNLHMCDDPSTTDMHYANVAGDCNNSNPRIFPGAPEIPNQKDDNCDGNVDEDATCSNELPSRTWYPDNDNDGFGVDTGDHNVVSCTDPSTASLAFANKPGDCDNDDPAVNPGATEIPGNQTDDDCDGVEDEPSVGDGPVTGGWGATSSTKWDASVMLRGFKFRIYDFHAYEINKVAFYLDNITPEERTSDHKDITFDIGYSIHTEDELGFNPLDVYYTVYETNTDAMRTNDYEYTCTSDCKTTQTKNANLPDLLKEDGTTDEDDTPEEELDAEDVFVLPCVDDTNLEFYLPFDDYNGDTIVELSDNEREGTPHNLTISDTAVYGTAGEFDGATTYIDFGTAPIGLEYEFTLMAWINPDTLGDQTAIMSKFTHMHGDIEETDTFQFGPIGADKFVVQFSPANGDYYDQLGNIATETWQQVTATYSGDDDSGTMNFYIDGELVETAVIGGGIMLENANTNFLISASYQNGYGAEFLDMYFDGFIDELMIFSRELSETEITDYITCIEE